MNAECDKMLTTSIRMSPLTLAYANRMKDFLGWITGRKYTLDQSILFFSMLADYSIWRTIGTIEEDWKSFVEWRLNEFSKDMTKKEIQEITEILIFLKEQMPEMKFKKIEFPPIAKKVKVKKIP